MKLYHIITKILGRSGDHNEYYVVANNVYEAIDIFAAYGNGELKSITEVQTPLLLKEL